MDGLLFCLRGRKSIPHYTPARRTMRDVPIPPFTSILFLFSFILLPSLHIHDCPLLTACYARSSYAFIEKEGALCNSLVAAVRMRGTPWRRRKKKMDDSHDISRAQPQR